jgi:hypothetical protein
MKTLLALIALSAVIAAPAFAQPASTAYDNLLASCHRWSSRVQAYAPSRNTFITQDENLEGYPRSGS